MNTYQKQQTFTIYHNPRCRKSRAGLEYFRGLSDENYEVVEYLKTGLQPEQFKKILIKLNLPASELVRKQEEEYKLSLKGKSFSEDEWIRIICNNPKLLKRPIIEGRYKAVIADPPEEMDSLFTLK
jgi:arsenate reductase (glutaredoxin)